MTWHQRGVPPLGMLPGDSSSLGGLCEVPSALLPQAGMPGAPHYFCLRAGLRQASRPFTSSQRCWFFVYASSGYNPAFSFHVSYVSRLRFRRKKRKAHSRMQAAWVTRWPHLAQIGDFPSAAWPWPKWERLYRDN